MRWLTCSPNVNPPPLPYAQQHTILRTCPRRRSSGPNFPLPGPAVGVPAMFAVIAVWPLTLARAVWSPSIAIAVRAPRVDLAFAHISVATILAAVAAVGYSLQGQTQSLGWGWALARPTGAGWKSVRSMRALQKLDAALTTETWRGHKWWI
jgi:hypothetical protein